ncbi:TPR domain protein, putative component of TonB system [hydrothermal vent metagenome]|uniref:TPR domain protein, putative component of TonB system n=1 Tax=hydrothermal vent metagenome TaxID=652676 RepID=A0A3B0RF01_9ZZZZ
MFAKSKLGMKSMIRNTGLAVLAAFAITAMAVPAEAQRRKNDEPKAEGRVVSAKVGEQILAAQEFLQAEPPQNTQAIAALNKALAIEKITPYEKAISLQMRGQAKYGAGDVRGTLADWEGAISSGGLIQTEIDNLQPNIGQLWISEGEFVKGATILESWINGGGKTNERIEMMIASAFSQVDQFRKALPHGEAGFRMASPKQKKHFDLLNFLYNSLKLYGKQARLLEQQVSIWPGDKQTWRSIASLKAQANKSKEAFEINKIMYLNGMLTSEQELLGLTQYYSFYEVPYRGAKILEREMNAGRVSKAQKNLQLLSDMWRQAREYEKAIPVLTQAADVASNGRVYEQLGEAYFAETQYVKAETAFRKALSKGGLKKPGNVYVLIANALYERDKPREALVEFKKGLNYSHSRKTASGWITFIKGGFEVERKKRAFQKAVKLDECKNQEDRVRRMGDTKIEGMESITEECVGILAAEVERIAAKKAAARAKASGAP